MSAAVGSSDLKETSSRDVAIVRTKITTERSGLNLCHANRLAAAA